MLNQCRFFKHLLPVWIAGTLTLWNACTYDVATPSYCFQEDVLPIFATKCSYTGCHDAASRKEGLNLTTYEGIMKGVQPGQPNQSEVYNEIRFGSMPPAHYPALSKSEKSIIRYWIKSGAPYSSNCVSCDSTYSYYGRIRPMIDKWCTSCHSGNNAGGSYDLSDYAGLVKSVQDGSLLGSLQHQSAYSPMPKAAGKLPECDLKAVQNWIAVGYPEN